MYPEDLLNWSGDKAGGVKKLFYTGSGRPSGEVIKTPLLERLSDWAKKIAKGDDQTPRALFLVGGPGNGKTEAIEFTIRELDREMGLNGELLHEFEEKYSGAHGPLGRRISSSKIKFPTSTGISEIAIVQDGSQVELGEGTPAEYLCTDIVRLLASPLDSLYLACVNRGVLDDALILSSELQHAATSDLIKQVVRAASLAAQGIDGWPLDLYPKFAVWPMDVESLVDEAELDSSAARQIINIATKKENWPEFGTCAAGIHCPFCTSRKFLSGDTHRSSYIKTLRWFELASGKRWNFRDLYSLTAFLLAGTTDADSGGAYEPCKWAASMLLVKESDPQKAKEKRVRGLFNLVAAQYQHAMFGIWPVEKAASLKKDLAELKLNRPPALNALHQFLSRDLRKQSTSTLRTQFVGMGKYLDPAFASSDLEVAVSGSTTIKLEDLDRYFSQSIKDGRIYLQRFQCLSPLEIELLKELEEADIQLSNESIRQSKPAVAKRVQAFIRLIACRIARRTLGVRSGVMKDTDVLRKFNLIANGDETELRKAAQQVEGLLNKDRRFLVSLNTTFGEPLPPPERRVMLTTDIQRVIALPQSNSTQRPKSPVRFLSVGHSTTAQPVALTYELFKATQSLSRGMVPASLPRSVVALLDATRSKLAGLVVRNEDALRGAEIRLGIRDEVILRNFEEFEIRKEDF
jgi:hypothetical protein